jgi:two-component system sensor histidine kinase SenX3
LLQHAKRTIEAVAAWVAGVSGALLGALLMAWLLRRPSTTVAPAVPEPLHSHHPSVPDGVAAVLGVLRSAAVLVGPNDEVVSASSPAYEMGVVRGLRLVEGQIVDLVRQVRRDQRIREHELVLGGRGGSPRHLVARVAPLGSSLVLVLAEDRSRERRVEAVRRDFTVNVSHELKTPVGALTLLAEAVGEAADDPDAVQRFSERMIVEANRLGKLVQQVVQLSRLQDDELLEDPERVDVDALIDAALDRAAIGAASRQITLAGRTGTDLAVAGIAGQLEVALGNLVDNAVTYSPEGTRVAVTATLVDGNVHVTVSDQGEGIPAEELERVFERFYRLDPARARSTGGTGLGLSIVKHVAASHGGEVRVWSQEGIGSSFTMVLPAWTEPAAAPPPQTARADDPSLQEATQ